MCIALIVGGSQLTTHIYDTNTESGELNIQYQINAMHYKLRGSIGEKKVFIFNWLAFAHFWSNFDEIFCAGVKP